MPEIEAPSPPRADLGPTAEVVEAVEHELGILMRRARSIAVETARDLHPELEPGAYGLLARLDQTAPARPTDLARYFGIGKATVSRQLKLLESLGLIGREPDEADRRAHRLVLTADGRQRLHQAQAARREWLRTRLIDWDEQDIQDLARSLARFNRLAIAGPNTFDGLLGPSTR